MKVAVLGLGAMGAAIARRLEASDAELCVFNRSERPAREFRERGVAVAPSAAEAAAFADVCITMLADGRAVEAVLLSEDGVLGASNRLGRPRTIVEMSTIDVGTSERIADRATETGVAYLRAPVSGNPTVVSAGNLTILVSGDVAAFAATEDLLREVGPTVLYLGEGERARVMKLALNLIVGGTTQLLAEALVMGQANGLDRAQMLEVIASSAVGSPFVRYKTGPLIADDYTPTFSARLMDKDLRLVIECANAAGVPVPVTANVQQLVQSCIGAGAGDLDFAVLVARLELEAGQRTSLPGAD
jgi:3-hydroxyisobutyrate dehydrogenase-like beta-hydroxyacid dehydrogenase